MGYLGLFCRLRSAAGWNGRGDGHGDLLAGLGEVVLDAGVAGLAY